MQPYIELTSLSSKRWLIRIEDIVLVEERTRFTDEELRRLPMLRRLTSCCTLTIRGIDETFWVKETYSSIKRHLTAQPE
ncbi:hypothetical protein [uncultured Alistipes sp.]|jgi:hypothetical protein|uniref:hypothetical protein n=1 Tax=uncultured Alistipes sp. TaxID=538949 RepID=UPI0025D23B34|nr:hypothetical protein [uncultured Alistipes sp.]